MTDYSYFELHRLSDDLVYQFDRKERLDGSFGYRRRDQDLWICYRNELGWVAFDEATQFIMGRPWNIRPEMQKTDHPPEDEWVSKKENKSYVYKLTYPQ